MGRNRLVVVYIHILLLMIEMVEMILVVDAMVADNRCSCEILLGVPPMRAKLLRYSPVCMILLMMIIGVIIVLPWVLFMIMQVVRMALLLPVRLTLLLLMVVLPLFVMVVLLLFVMVVLLLFVLVLLLVLLILFWQWLARRSYNQP